MTIIKKIIPVLIIFLLFISCRKDIVEKNSDFEGDWFYSKDTSVHSFSIEHADLKINSDSHLCYHSYNDMGETVWEFCGDAKVSGDKIHVSGVLAGHNFHIVSSPTKINSPPYQWQMKLTGPYGTSTLTYYR